MGIIFTTENYFHITIFISSGISAAGKIIKDLQGGYMKRTACVFLAFILVFTAGCATELVNTASMWPAINHGFAHYEPKAVSSEEEAVSNIRSSQGYAFISGRKPYDVVADRYSAIYKIQWTEQSTYVDEVPTTGGFFIGWDYIPTYSTTTQTYHSSEQKQDNMTVVFKDITGIYFYRNDLCVASRGGTNYIGANSRESLMTLADSIYTLAMAQGASIEKDVNFEFTPLSPKQCKMLNIDRGDMVTSVFEGSEGDRAGIREGDILLNVKSISESGGFRKFFASGKILKMLRWTQNGGEINYRNVTIKMKGGK